MPEKQVPDDKSGVETRADNKAASVTHQADGDRSVVVEFAQSLAYSGAVQPARAVAQLVDNALGVKTEGSVKSVFEAIGISAPKPAEFGTAAWAAQQLGSAVGMLPYMRAPGSFGATKAVANEAMISRSMFQASIAEGKHMAQSGYIYGFVFTPTEEKTDGTIDFLGHRLKQGITSATSFGAMGFANPSVSNTLGMLASKAGSEKLKTAIANPITAGIASGIPGGFINAEIGAWEQGKLYASAQELKENIAGMALVGGILAGGHMVRERYGKNNNHAAPEERTVENSPQADARTLPVFDQNWQLPEHLQTTNLRALKTIERAWPVLSESQRLLPADKLLPQVHVINSFGLNARNATRVSENLEFLNWHEKHINSAFNRETIDGNKLFECWLENPSERSRSSEDLWAFGSLTAEQKRSGRVEDYITAVKVLDLHAEPHYLSDHADLLEWATVNAYRLRYTRAEGIDPREIARNWSAMPSELKTSQPEELLRAAKVWPHLSESQRANLSPSDILILGRIAERAGIYDERIRNADAEFVSYYVDHGEHLRTVGGAVTARILEGWPYLTATERQLPWSPSDFQLIAAVPSEVRNGGDPGLFVAYTDLCTQFDFKREQLERVPREFVDWSTRNKSSLMTSREINGSHLPRVADLWNQFTKSQQELGANELLRIARAWDHLSERQRQLPGKELARIAAVSNHLSLPPEVVQRLSPTVVALHEHLLDTMPRGQDRWIRQAQELATVWHELPKSIQDLAINPQSHQGLLEVAQAWNKLNESQRAQTPAALISQSTIANKLQLASDEVAKLGASREFVKWFADRYREPASLPYASARSVLRHWEEMPKSVRDLPSEKLETIANAWHLMTPQQKRLPEDQMFLHSHAITTLELGPANVRFLLEHPEFAPWLNSQASTSPADFKKVARTEKLMAIWDLLPADKTALTVEQARTIGDAWDRLTETQKSLPITELAAQARAVRELIVDPFDSKLVEKAPGFAHWYYRVEDGRTTHYFEVLKIWNSLPSEFHNLGAKQLWEVAEVWPNLSDLQRGLPAGELLAHVKTAHELRLDEHQTRHLQNLQGFAQWYASASTSSEAGRSVMSIWEHLTPEVKAASPHVVEEIARVYDRLSLEQRALPLSELADLSHVVRQLDLPAGVARQLPRDSFILDFYKSVMSQYERDGKLPSNVNDWFPRHSGSDIARVWSELPPHQRPLFEAWLRRNYPATPTDAPARTQALNQIIRNFKYLTEAEMSQPPHTVLEKAELPEYLTLRHDNLLVESGNLPVELIQRISALKPWQQIAAIEAFHDARSAYVPDSARYASSERQAWEQMVFSPEFRESFEARLQDRLKARREAALSSESDAIPLMVRTYFPNMPLALVKVISHSLPKTEPHRHIQNLRPQEFEKIMTRLLEGSSFADFSERIKSADALDGFGHQVVGDALFNRTWHADSAVRLLSTFGKQWERWLNLNAARGVSAHDASVWLSVVPHDASQSLSQFLFKFNERPVKELTVIAQRWRHMNEQQRNSSYKDVLATAMSARYENARDSYFAAEAARWGIEQYEYSDYERRYLDSHETPSPFPLEKTWANGDLTLRFIPRNDPRGLFLGKHTDCCQHPDGAGSASAWLGQEHPHAGFVVVENKKGEVVAQSLVWESDHGALVIDSIEGKGLEGRQDAIAGLYETMANDLKSKYHTINVGTGINAGNEGIYARWPHALNPIKLPFDYSEYTDAAQQVTVATNPQLAPREKPKKTAWVREAQDADRSQLNAVLQQVYPQGWQFTPDGHRSRVVQVRGDGVVGGYVMDTQARAINDVFVHPDYRHLSRTLLFDLLHQMRSVGPENWSASVRDSTSYRLLEMAARARWLTIHSQQKERGATSGEDMHNVIFSLAPHSHVLAPSR